MNKTYGTIGINGKIIFDMDKDKLPKEFDAWANYVASNGQGTNHTGCPETGIGYGDVLDSEIDEFFDLIYYPSESDFIAKEAKPVKDLYNWLKDKTEDEIAKWDTVFKICVTEGYKMN